jgi:tyrosinase
MSVVRRNILSDANARDKFIAGVKLLKAEVLQPDGPNTYDLFVIWHHQTMMRLTPPNQGERNAAHSGPVFLPWHRHMLIEFERHLQRVLQDANFGLPYWAWHADGDLPRQQQPNAAVWQNNCLGGSGSPVVTGPFAFNSNDPTSWRVTVEATINGQVRPTNRGLRRRLAQDQMAPTLPTTQQAKQAVTITTYDTNPWNRESNGSFRNLAEGWPNGPQLHNRIHVWIGGDMGPSTSPNDPAFYLNHCNADRMWAAWQAKHPNAPYLPGDNAPNTLRFHRLNDRMISIFPGNTTPNQMLSVSSIYTYDVLSDLQ